MTKPSSAALCVYQNIGRGVHPDKQLAIIQSALDEARNDALEEAAKVVEPTYEFEVFYKRRKAYADKIRKLKTRGDGND